MNTEKTFDSYIMEKYPSLFAKDADGNPRKAECGLYCPTGWQHIVDSLCSSIDWRLRNPDRVQTWKRYYDACMFIHKTLYRPIYKKIYRLVDPLEKHYWKDGVRNDWTMIHSEMRTNAEKNHPIKTKLKEFVSKFGCLFRPEYRWEIIPTPPVVIGQVKQKFGTMRFYFSGGDEHIRSIVSFAEVMTGAVCEKTGEPGKMHQKGFWYKTLSEDEGKKLGYSAVK